MGQQQSAEKPENLKELASKMDFTEEEIEAWYKQFRADNPDGKIGHAKMKELYNKIYPHGDADAFSNDIYRVLDANHDNSIDFTEFMTAIQMSRKGTNEEKCRAAFKLYDKDGKGTISRDEMVAVFESFDKLVNALGATVNHQHTVAEVDKIFKDADKSQDGELSAEEFVNYAKTHPAVLVLLNFEGTRPDPKPESKTESA